MAAIGNAPLPPSVAARRKKLAEAKAVANREKGNKAYWGTAGENLIRKSVAPTVARERAANKAFYAESDRLGKWVDGQFQSNNTAPSVKKLGSKMAAAETDTANLQGALIREKGKNNTLGTGLPQKQQFSYQSNTDASTNKLMRPSASVQKMLRKKK